jgi:hypothetical protein
MQIALALQHVHAAGVVHLDVKPANVFLVGSGADEQIKLGDFDVSVSNESRATVVANAITVTAMAAAFTPEYAAPEIVNRRAATSAADMYSLGLILLDLHLAMKGRDPSTRPKGDALTRTDALVDAVCDPVTHRVPEHLVPLLCSLLADDPRKRPSATAVLAHKYFTDGALALAAESAARERETAQRCAICLETVPSARGLECPQRVAQHFLCNECLTRKVTADCQVADGNALLDRAGQVFCVGYTLQDSPCASSGAATAYADRDLAGHLPPAAFECYMRARHECVSARLHREKDEEVRQRVASELERLRAQSEAQRQFAEAYRHIVDDLLTLRCDPLPAHSSHTLLTRRSCRCPNHECRQAFIDFEGCFALSCSRCSAAFCGWCLAFCGVRGDAHAHVRCCPHRSSEDPLFGSLEQFSMVTRRRQRDDVRLFMATLPAPVAERLRSALATQLADLQL